MHFAACFAADGHVIDVMMTELSNLLERAKDTCSDRNDDNDNGDDSDLEAGGAHRQSTRMRSSSSSRRRRNDANYYASSSSFLVRLVTLGMYKSKPLQNDEDASQTDGLLASVEACLPSEPLLAPDRRRRTPLACACAGPRSAGRPEVVRYLLLHATNPAEVITFPDERSRTAIDLVMDDYQEEIEDALKDGTDATDVANCCLGDDGILRECWSILVITLLLVASTANSATTAKEWLARGASIYYDSSCVQAVHGACRTMGDDCPAQLSTLARKIVQADVDKESIGTVKDLRDRWEGKATTGNATY